MSLSEIQKEFLVMFIENEIEKRVKIIAYRKLIPFKKAKIVAMEKYVEILRSVKESLLDRRNK